MRVERLSLTDFRSYSQAEIEFRPGVSVLLGPNGQGKTNLIEAVGYLATLGSHRVATDAPLVRAGAERAVVRALAVRDGRQALVELEITPGRANRARINRSPVPRPREILGLVRTVLFAPEDLALVKGEPAERRRFLDDLLVQRTPRLAGVRSDYDRVLRQRNALLKSAGVARRGSLEEVVHTLEVWDEQLADLGAGLLAARQDLVAALAPFAAAAYEQVAPSGDPLGLAYASALTDDGVLPRDAASLRAAVLAALERRRKEELDRGVTLVGPHRDDLTLTLGALPAKGYASHGESWSVALALRLASYELLRADAGADGDPILVLDDVFAELDAGRRARLAALVAPAGQVIVTAAVPADVPDGLDGERFEVSDGQVQRAG